MSTMTYYKTDQTFRYTWEQVVTAFWKRYPNPHSKHVLTEDVVQRCVDSQGRLYTQRLLSKTNSAPKWTERFLPAKFVYIIEESIIDLKSRTLTTYTRNIGMQHLMSIEEKVTYRPKVLDGPINNNTAYTTTCTTSEKQVWINSSFYGLSAAIKRFGLERYKKNIQKAYKGYEYTLEALYGKAGKTLAFRHTQASPTGHHQHHHHHHHHQASLSQHLPQV